MAKKVLSQAEKFKQAPDADWKQAVSGLAALSASSKSTARTDREFDDGSCLSAISHDGDEVTYLVEEPPAK